MSWSSQGVKWPCSAAWWARNSVSRISCRRLTEEYEALIPRIPMHRMGRPAEVAAAVFRLCTADFGYVTGTEIFVTGGQHLY